MAAALHSGPPPLPAASARELLAARAPALVVGMGGTGASCARFLAAKGVAATFADTRTAPPGLAAIRAVMPGAKVFSAEMPGVLPAEIRWLIVSPGVDLRLPLLDAARARGLPILSDIDLFGSQVTAPVIAITGSNGKSTVTSMLARMLTSAGRRTVAGGNLGTPALDLLDPAVDTYVLELSSFQLERSEPVEAAAAVVLNVTPDHLDIHGDLAAYQAAKARVYLRCDVAVVNRDAPGLEQLVPDGIPTVGFGLGEPAAGDFGIRQQGGTPWLALGGEGLLPVSALQVRGSHNAANALAALALGVAAGADAETLLPGLQAYIPLPHRMALVASLHGIDWLDDSKATNVGAAVTSIGSVAGPLVLVAGGDAKGAHFDSLADALRGRECVVILLGRDRELIATALDGICPVRRVTDMEAAVAEAARVARNGWTVLLAPACSSLDMYRDYGARGDAFRDAVLGLTGKPAGGLAGGAP